MKTKYKALTVGIIAVMAAAAVYPAAASAQVTSNASLGNMVVLDQLFSGTNTIGGASASSLGDLFVLNSLFGSGSGASSVLSNTSKTGIKANNIGDLFVLNRLFASNNSIFRGNQTDLGDMIILDKLFGGGKALKTSGTTSGVLGSTSSNSLGNLFVLDRLFGGSGSGLFANRSNSLGDLFILDNIFN
jgi:hypothetical protein